MTNNKTSRSVFHWIRQAEFAYDGSILSSSQIFATAPADLKMKLAIKVV